MKPKNMLLIMSDEHDPRYMGVSGHPIVKTPALDRLAERGTRFSNAYTPCAICVPARASFATGQYVHNIRYWDNAMGYDGRVRGWGHRLQEKHVRVDSIGKLHFKSEHDPIGFDNQIKPMHIHEGIGLVWGSVRDPLPKVPPVKLYKKLGAGVSNYNIYDRQVANETCDWLKQRSEDPDQDRPWMLYVGMTAPHMPLVVPREYLDRYPPECVPPRKLHPRDGYRQHPWIQAQNDYICLEAGFADDAEKALAVRSYFGLCSFLDAQIGLILDCLEDCGLAQDTVVMYTSDHGDNLGARGLWGKSNLYEETTKIPMIVAGPEVPVNRVCNTPVNLVDCYPTILDAVGVPQRDEEKELPGRSLLDIMRAPDDPERIAFSEYHASGAVSGAYMLRKGRYKYHYYVGLPPELFDLENDPEETIDLAADPAFKSILENMAHELRLILDPEKTDKMAKADQAELVRRYGGREKALKMGNEATTPVPGRGNE